MNISISGLKKDRVTLSLSQVYFAILSRVAQPHETSTNSPVQKGVRNALDSVCIYSLVHGRLHSNSLPDELEKVICQYLQKVFLDS